jgi:hypothetical protein
MKRYTGDRTMNGIQVLVDGEPLAPRFKLRMIAKNGFEWSYEGDEPNQLALALLADHLGDDSKALALYEGFMRRIVANFGNEWEMTGSDIDTALANICADAA